MFQLEQMSQRPQRSDASDASWLAMLVDRFEQASRPDLRAVPCEEWVLEALKAQLARPTLPRDGRKSEIRRQD